MLLQKNKCELCALKVIFDQDRIHGNVQRVENFITVLRELQKENIIDQGYNRKVYASNTGDGDKSEMCAINSDFFTKRKDEKCSDFILNMNLSVPEALSLHTARSTDKLTRNIHHMTIGIGLLTFISVIVAIATIYK